MTERTTSAGVSVVGVITIVFVILKLVGVISWKWVWVFSPIWLSADFVVGIGILALVGFSIIAIADFVIELVTGKE